MYWFGRTYEKEEDFKNLTHDGSETAFHTSSKVNFFSKNLIQPESLKYYDYVYDEPTEETAKKRDFSICIHAYDPSTEKWKIIGTDK